MSETIAIRIGMSEAFQIDRQHRWRKTDARKIVQIDCFDHDAGFAHHRDRADEAQIREHMAFYQIENTGTQLLARFRDDFRKSGERAMIEPPFCKDDGI